MVEEVKNAMEYSFRESLKINKMDMETARTIKKVYGFFGFFFETL